MSQPPIPAVQSLYCTQLEWIFKSGHQSGESQNVRQYERATQKGSNMHIPSTPPSTLCNSQTLQGQQYTARCPFCGHLRSIIRLHSIGFDPSNGATTVFGKLPLFTRKHHQDVVYGRGSTPSNPIHHPPKRKYTLQVRSFLNISTTADTLSHW